MTINKSQGQSVVLEGWRAAITVGTNDGPLTGLLSQKVTYLFCDELDIVSKELRSRVRQATKDVVKSEV